MATRLAVIAGRAQRFVSLLLVILFLVSPTPYPVEAAPPRQLDSLPAGKVISGVIEQVGSDAIALGDVDLDGDLDLVAVQDDVIVWYRNNPGSRGAPGTSLTEKNKEFLFVGRLPATQGARLTPSVHIALADMNGDGSLDLVAAKEATLQIYIDSASSNLWLTTSRQEPIVLSADSDNTLEALEVGDIDNDGDYDILRFGNTVVSQYLNPGGEDPWATPVIEQRLFAATEFVDFALGDLNGDAYLDIVTCGVKGCSFMLNPKQPGPWPGQPTRIGAATPFRTFSVALGDVDKDQDLDVIMGDVNVTVYFNNGQADGWAEQKVLTAFVEIRDIALGDVDTDGYLDVIVGREDGLWTFPNRLGSGAQPWPTPNSGSNWSTDRELIARMAIGDLDNDRDLDVVAVDLASNSTKLYSNIAVAQPWGEGSAITAPTDNPVLKLADFDNDPDHDLDLVVGSKYDVRYYENNGLGRLWSGNGAGTVITETRQVSVTNPIYKVLETGYIDEDEHLDLVVGTDFWAALVFYNSAGTLPFSTTVEQEVVDQTRFATAVILRDINGDGRAELTVATGEDRFTGGSGPKVYSYNPDNPTNPWSSYQITTTVASDAGVADVDSDGDADLLIVNTLPDSASAPELSSLYLNSGDASPWKQTPRTYEFPVRAMKLGDSGTFADVDGDGDVDLIGSGKLLLNNGTDNPYSPSSAAITLSTAEAGTHALGDIDNDGDLDLVQAISSGSNYFVNQGGAPSWLGFAPGNPTGQNSQASDLASGDVDHDGDLDLVIGADKQPVRLFLNRLSDQAYLRDTPSRLVVAQPLLPAASGVISVPFTLQDAEGDMVREVRGEYSLDGGGKWLPALTDDISATRKLSTSVAGKPYNFRWDLQASGVVGTSDNVVFRLVALPDLKPVEGSVASSYRFASVAANTAPFRIGGLRVHVTSDKDEDQDGKPDPATGALVYRIIPTRPGQGDLAPARREGQPQLYTDHLGYLQGRGPLGMGDRLVAMSVFTSTDTYTLYHTSAGSSAKDGLAAQRIETFGVQELQVSSEHPLLLFNLDVSVEWDTRGDQSFERQLGGAIRRASDLLFRWSEGQIALGNVRVYHNREQWNTAHIRVYATNRMRPSAAKGGIVTEPMTDTVQLAGRLPIVYNPGQIRMGAVWNRYGDAGAGLGDDWARTLAHELGHYALYLDDNYLGIDKGQLTSIGSCPSPMTDPYRDDYGEFHPNGVGTKEPWIGTTAQPACENTLSQLESGRSDWDTIDDFYPALKAPETFSVTDNPAILPLLVTRVTFQDIERPEVAPAPLEAPIVVLSTGNGPILQGGPDRRAYLFHSNRRGDWLTDLGTPAINQVVARGARENDTVCVFEPSKDIGGCQVVSRSFDQLQLGSLGRWRPDIRVTPENSTTLRLDVLNVTTDLTGTINLTEADNLTGTLKARLYPVSSSAQVTTTLAPDGVNYTGVLTSTEELPVFEGYIHVWLEHPSSGERLREAVVDFLLGGNPGGKYSHGAPQGGNPGGKYSHGAPVLSADGQAILYSDQNQPLPEDKYFSLQAGTIQVPPPPWATLVGRAYRLIDREGLVADDSWLSISYLAEDAPREYETGIRMYYLPEKGQEWELLDSQRRDALRNEASARVAGPGLYALMSSVEIRLLKPDEWNLVYFYPGATMPISAALSAAEGEYTAVYSYDGTTPDNPWRMYAVDAPPWANEFTELKHGEGYWIRTTAALTQPLTVPLMPKPTNSDVASPDPGLLSPPPTTYYALLPASRFPGATSGMTVTASIDGNPCASATTDDVTDGIGFVIDIPATCGLTESVASNQGRQLVISVGGHTFTTDWKPGENLGPRRIAPTAWR